MFKLAKFVVATRLWDIIVETSRSKVNLNLDILYRVLSLQIRFRRHPFPRV